MYSTGGSPLNRFAAVASGSGYERGMYSDDGSNWSLIGSQLGSKTWESVTYGNGKYVAVASYAPPATANLKVSYSYNGIDWQLPIAGSEDNSWQSVSYAPEHIAPPATWYAASATEANYWKSVAYGNGKFVAVASSGTTNRIMYSTDGITWSNEGVTIENSLVESWQRVAYGDYMGYGTGTAEGQGRWVAASQNEIIYSDDGITWYESTPSSTQFTFPEDIIYANGTFILVSNQAVNEILTSITGGKTWEKVDISNYDYHGLAYGNNTIVAIAESNNPANPAIAICNDLPDLATWTTVYSGFDGEDWEDIAYGNGTFVAVGKFTTQNIIYSTDDGLTWKAASGQNTTNDFKKVVYANGYFVAVAYNSDQAYELVSYSSDGINWTIVTVPQDNQWQSVAYGDGKFVAVSQDGTNRVMYSESLIPNRFVAVSSDGTNRVMYSDNGIKWTAASAYGDSTWSDITYGDGKFVAVASLTTGASNRAMYSYDGDKWWEAEGAVTANTWYSVTYGNGKFVAVAGSSGSGCMYSSDGITWTIASIFANDWRSVTYGDGKFVAVAANAAMQPAVAYSVDGITWSSTAATEVADWSSVAYGDNKFVSVNENGTNRAMYTPTSIDAKSFDFNGDNQYVQTDANSLLEIGAQDFTMSCWFKYDVVKSEHILIDNRTAHGNGTTISLAQVGSYMRARVWEDGENAYLYASDTDLMPNVWYNVTYAMDKPDGKFYINGVRDDSNNIEYDYVYTGGNKLTLAWNYSKQVNKSFNGKMSNVLFYVGKALTESEVLQNYNALKGRYK